MSIGSADISGVRQLLLQHAYSPLVSIQSTHNADLIFQGLCMNTSVSALSVLQPYGNNAKYPAGHQAYRITNASLITRNYGSFPVRFAPSLPELLTVHSPTDDKLSALFSISSLEHLMRKFSRASGPGADPAENSLYLSMFRKIITSNRVVPFDTFNHPVAHIFIIDYATDSMESVRKLVVEFRNYAFPKYFQNSDVLVHILVLYNTTNVEESEVQKFQTALRTELSITSTGVPIPDVTPENAEGPGDSADFLVMPELENATIEQEVQNLTLQMANSGDSGGGSEGTGIRVPKALDQMLRYRIFEFIARHLIPHMERKIRTWDDSVLAPKKSIAGRFFSVSRKLFNNSNSSGDSLQSTVPGTYNHAGNYYHRSAPEQIIRKLADWSLMMKDFKYAYSTYDLIKKDYTNDKAWAYVASTQEMCIVSVLLAQTQPLGSDMPPQKPDKNTLRKIRHDIIEPYVDNLTYTYKSRFNVKTYAVRSYLVAAELLLNMSMLFNIPWWWSDLIEDYFMKAERELEVHLSSATHGPQATRAILFERLGFVKRHGFFVPSDRQDIVESIFENGIYALDPAPAEDGFYVNTAKMPLYNDTAVKGLTRFRKSSFWYVMSMHEWMLLENTAQIRSLMGNLSIRYAAGDDDPDGWYNRENLALSQIKQYLRGNEEKE